MGIEPTQPAWKAGALPLSYTRNVAAASGEPGGHEIGAEDEIRTRDIRLGKATLYH